MGMRVRQLLFNGAVNCPCAATSSSVASGLVGGIALASRRSAAAERRAVVEPSVKEA